LWRNGTGLVKKASTRVAMVRLNSDSPSVIARIISVSSASIRM
jgi:hypothetical protein